MKTSLKKQLRNSSNRGGRLLSAVVIAAISIIALSSVHAGQCFDLGAARSYAAFILPGGSSIDMTINGGAAVIGDVAASANMHIDLGSEAKVGPGEVVNGEIYLDPNGATVKLDKQDPNSVEIRNLSQAVLDAQAANQAAAALPPTQNLGALDVKDTYTVFGKGGCNVIALNSVKLHGSGILIIHGSATDTFIFNITGDYTQSSKSSVQIEGGVKFRNIVWNFVGTGSSSAKISGAGNIAYGTFLAPYRPFSITDATLYGQVIAQGHLAIGSKALVSCRLSY